MAISIKKIKQHNPQTFIDDIKRVRGVMVYAENTNSYYSVLKKEVLHNAESSPICYYITDKIFLVKRDIMVII